MVGAFVLSRRVFAGASSFRSLLAKDAVLGRRESVIDERGRFVIFTCMDFLVAEWPSVPHRLSVWCEPIFDLDLQTLPDIVGDRCVHSHIGL